MTRLLFTLLLLYPFGLLSASGEDVIKVSAEQKCAGYPRVKNFKVLNSKKCLGLALTSDDVPWGKPRRLAFKNQNTIIVTDMGGWTDHDAGVVWEIDLETKAYRKIYEGGDWTHGLAIDRRGRLLVGDTDKIVRIDESGAVQKMITDLPKKGSHPISHFILLPDQSLILNVGAPTNDCSKEMEGSSCSARDLFGELRLYQYKETTDDYASEYRVLARGLRNSMALAYNENLNQLYQAENNLDASGIPEEFNLIHLARSVEAEPADFGWPFCYGMGEQYVFPKSQNLKRNTFKTFCGRVADRPMFLVPAHSAPLDMMYYKGEAHPELQGKILMTWHGHRRASDFSFVAYDTDDEGAPVYSEEKEMGPYLGLVKGLSSSNPKHKLRPVGMAEDGTGRIWIVDDINKVLLVYANTDEEISSPGDGVDETGVERAKEIDDFIGSLSEEEVISFESIYGNFYSSAEQTCLNCHGKDEIPSDSKEALKVFLENGWWDLSGDANSMLFFKRTSPGTAKPMPPSGAYGLNHLEDYKALRDWVSGSL